MPLSESEVRLLIPHSAEWFNEWDQEWCRYFTGENPSQFFLPESNLSARPEIASLSAEQVYASSLCNFTPTPNCQYLADSRVWIPGTQFVGKNVVEIGYGAGLLGKQVGKYAAAYLGVDTSRFALSIARLVSPLSCRYLHLSAWDEIMAWRGCFDLMYGREFFIHQNWRNARWLLGLAYLLLKPGATLAADFFSVEDNPMEASPAWAPGSADLTLSRLSRVYHHSRSDFVSLVSGSGLEVLEIYPRPDHRRLYTTLVRTGRP